MSSGVVSAPMDDIDKIRFAMNKLRHTTFAVIMALFCCFPSACGKGGTIADIGRAAPDFTLRDLSGRDVRLAALRGSVVLLNFWATWCPPCGQELPSLARLNSRMNGQPFRMLAVAVDEGGAETVERFFRQVGIRLPALTDPSGSVALRYGVRGLPETFIIDRQGIVRKKIVGPLTWDDPAMVSYLVELAKF